MKYNVIKKPSKAFAKKFNLEFCPRFGYYTGDAYVDSKGETLKNYMYWNGKVYSLKYLSGCFNPFLVEWWKKSGIGFGELIDGKKTQIVRVDSYETEGRYEDRYGDNFRMIQYWD